MGNSLAEGFGQTSNSTAVGTQTEKLAETLSYSAPPRAIEGIPVPLEMRDDGLDDFEARQLRNLQGDRPDELYRGISPRVQAALDTQRAREAADLRRMGIVQGANDRGEDLAPTRENAERLGLTSNGISDDRYYGSTPGGAVTAILGNASDLRSRDERIASSTDFLRSNANGVIGALDFPLQFGRATLFGGSIIARDGVSALLDPILPRFGYETDPYRFGSAGGPGEVLGGIALGGAAFKGASALLNEFSSLGVSTQRTLRAYQSAYDDAARAFERDIAAGNITQPRGLDFNTWKGGQIDAFARAEMNAWKQINNMDDLLVNRRLSTAGGIKEYRVPDLFLPAERTVIDGTIGAKSLTTPQIRDFFNSGRVDRVILVSPNQKPTILTIEQLRAGVR